MIAKNRSKEEIIADIRARRATPEQVAIMEEIRASLRRYIPEGVSLSEELIAERRREAERE